MGVLFASQTGDTWDDTVAYRVSNSSNWVYTGTGLANGTRIPLIVGYEADRQSTGFPQPVYQGQSYVQLAQSPFTDYPNGGSDLHNSTVYQATSGSWVFAAGSQGWNYALARAGYTNAGIQQATANVLNKFITN